MKIEELSIYCLMFNRFWENEIIRNMGWYTELTVGEYHWSWRKSLPVEIPLLFLGKHKVIAPDETITIESNKFIGYEATVNQVISNLNNLGLTLDFFISIYEGYRKGFMGWGLGFLTGRKETIEYFKKKGTNYKEKISEINKLIKRIENGSAKNDIESAIILLKDKVELKSSLLEDESLIPSLIYVRMDTDLNQPNIIEATNFGTFLSYAHENLPEIAWLFEIRIILETLSKKSKAKLDLKEWVIEMGEIDIMANSISSLGLKAKTYNRTFDTILGGKKTYITEYERVKISDLWKKLKAIDSIDPYKGTLLEDFIASLFHKSFGFDVLEKNLLVETQELDVVLKNTSKSDFIKSLNSPFVLVECKNWTTPVGVSEARVFESKYRDFGNKVKLGLFVAINGVTKNFKSHINNLMRDNINLIIIDDKHIEQYLYSEDLDLNKWLEDLISRQFIQKK